jgi:hypothetical protein
MWFRSDNKHKKCECIAGRIRVSYSQDLWERVAQWGADPSHLAPNILSIRIDIRKRPLLPDGFWNVAKSQIHSLAENRSAKVAFPQIFLGHSADPGN